MKENSQNYTHIYRNHYQVNKSIYYMRSEYQLIPKTGTLRDSQEPIQEEHGTPGTTAGF
jgi:hypothetical protein